MLMIGLIIVLLTNWKLNNDYHRNGARLDMGCDIFVYCDATAYLRYETK